MKTTTEKQLRKILDGCIVLQSVNDRGIHSRVHDDHDGTFEGQLTVAMGPDGDMYLWLDRPQAVRFRNFSGGGASLRVHNALRILAEAIRLDNLDRPRVRPADQLPGYVD